ncbi:MATE family efflux transporter [Acetoanaerobium noterae]|uniref:MATE family efflux transporter n=1 Tax=Acetoanaerobium noterae TaxID=745369 RepID=UPI0028AC7CE9|nr:MATE family efflux transporter [Acetoanaerobium noterae]
MKTNNLTQGSILSALFKLAIPIMGTSFVQMAYNMTDMIWVGRVGSRAVAAVGTAGFFTWLAMAFILIPKIGAEVGVAQSIGKNDMKEAKVYIKHTLQMIVVIALIYALSLITFRKPLIGFFNLGEPDIIQNAINYLVIISFGLVFYFINPVFTAIFNGYGESRTPFIINSIGLLVNMVLDPLLILGLGPIPRLEVAGAAIATVIAQAVVTIIFVLNARMRPELFSGLNLFKAPDMAHINKIFKLGLPVALQSGLFTVFAMVIARIIAQWGPIPIAVQKVGSQIEAVSWMTAGGFQTAMSTFVGQNYGAKNWARISKGYMVGLAIMTVIGIFTTGLLYFGARPIFSIFIPEAESISYGVVYLKILALSQLFMCIELTTAGAFNGLGNTVPPSIIGIVFNALRIPGALILSATSLGLNGVWWAISISSIFKGVILATWYMMLLKKSNKAIGEVALEP